MLTPVLRKGFLSYEVSVVGLGRAEDSHRPKLLCLQSGLNCQGLDWASLAGQRVKNLPAMQEIRVQSLGCEDPLEKVNGNPLQCSCLENPIDRGAWQAADHGVARVGRDLATKPTYS